MSEAESRIKCGAEIYSNNNNNNNEGGNEEESTKNRTNLSSYSTTIPNLVSGQRLSSQYPSPVRPFITSGSTRIDNRLLPLSLLSPNSKGHTKLQTQSQKNPVNSNNKKIRLPLPPPSKSSGKNRKDSSIPIGIAVARQRHVNVTNSSSIIKNTLPAMSSQNPNPGVINSKAKRESPSRPSQIQDLSSSLIKIKSDRHKKAPTIMNRSNTTSGIKKSSSVSHTPEPRDSVTISTGAGTDSARSGLSTTEIGLVPADSVQVQRHLHYAERGRLTENGVGRNNEFSSCNSRFAHNPIYGDWSSQLNVPHLPPGYNTASASYMQQQHQQLSMHPEMPLQLSQTFGYNISPYMYSGYPAESILQYEQFFRQQQQQQQQSREDQLRQQQQQQHLHTHDYDINRSVCRSVTPIPSLSPRISIPSPSPNPTLNLYSNHHHWPTDLYQHHHYFTSSTATLSPRSLTSSTPSPVTVHDSHSYLLARKCITPNPIGVGSGSKHFSFSSPFSPSLLPARDVWKDLKIPPISNSISQKIIKDKNESGQSPNEPEADIERAIACQTPGSARHDFRRMESLIEKRAEESVPILLHSPVELDVDDINSNNSNSRSLSFELEVKVKEPKLEPILTDTKVCDGMELTVPESTVNFGSISALNLAATRKGQTKMTRKKAGARLNPRRPSSCSKNDTQKGNSEKYFIPVKREFYEFDNSNVEAPCNYSTKSLLSDRNCINMLSPCSSSTIPVTTSSDTTQKSIAVIDISRVKKEVVENIYIEDKHNRTSAAGDDPPDWRSRRPETEGCSDADTDFVNSYKSQDLEYYGEIPSITENKSLVTLESSVAMETSRSSQECDSDIIHRDLSNFSTEQQSHNITVTVNCPPPVDGGRTSGGNFSPINSSNIVAYDSDMPSFPKIVISSAESHLNLLATVAQEIGPYISMNTNRSPRRYESLIQIESAEISERRPSISGSCGSTSTSTMSRISIDENTNFSPVYVSQAVPASDHETTPSKGIICETEVVTEEVKPIALEAIPTLPAQIPYQLKIPQIIPRLQTKQLKKDREKPVKPKKISSGVRNETKIGRFKTRPIGSASTKLAKKPKNKTSEFNKNISTGKIIFNKKISKQKVKVGCKIDSSSSQPLNPCIYDFDDTKPKLEPLYNRLEKQGHTKHRRSFEEPVKMMAVTAVASPISNHDLKSKSSSSSNNDKIKLKNSTKKIKDKNVTPVPVNTTQVKMKLKIPKEINKKPKGVDTVIIKPIEMDSTTTMTSNLVPWSISTTPIPTIQPRSIFTAITCQAQGQDSNSNESSMWVTDPVHAVTAIKNLNVNQDPVLPRRISAEEKALRKRRKAMKPSKLTFLNANGHGNTITMSTNEPNDDPLDAPNIIKSQLKSFVHFATRKKNGHHHIKPCLKAEPEFREEIPTSEESEFELEDLDKDLKTESTTPSVSVVVPKPIKIRKPSIDMNIFSRRVRTSEDCGKDIGTKNSVPGEGTENENKDQELQWNENVVIAGVEEMLDEMRILTDIQGLFYTGKLNALQPPDVYGVTLDNERGAPPHLIYSAEEVLEKCIREAKPWKASQLPHGLRICAYWSPQYSGLYPGKVSTDYDTVTDLVPVEFDDGDTGVIKIGEIRLLAVDHPIREYDPNPLLTLEKKHRKRRHSSATGSQISECNGLHEDADCGESYCAKVAKMRESEDEELSDCQESSSLMYWTWSGLGYKRPGTKKNRNKEFFHGIQRGDEIINVGDSALFISNTNARPFLGRVERFWEKKGKKIVNVRWFYHPEEVKTKKRLTGIKYPGALFESPHIDENDVQTIAKKCEVLPFDKFHEKYGHRFTSKAGRNLSGQKKASSPKDIYYLAGYYDPYTYNLKLNDLNLK